MKDKNNQVDRYLKQMEKHARKQKLRKARKKNRPRHTAKQPRLKKLNPTDWEQWEDLEFDDFEPILSKGTRDQRRKVELQAFGVDPNSDIDTEPNSENSSGTERFPGETGTRCLVLEAGSGVCRVDLHGENLLCELRGSLKDEETGYTNPIAVGDWVLVRENGTDRGVVESVLPRRSVLSRPYSPDEGVLIADLQQVVAANVDRLLIVASWREPYIWPAMIDRYLIAAQRNNIQPIICINKTDLIEDQVEFDDLIKPYQELSHRLLLTSAVTKQGLDTLEALLKEGATVLAGLSGVGKSTLLTEIQPSLDLKIGKVSESGLFTGQGRHTTTHTSLIQLDNGGIVIDTPGVRSFSLAGIAPDNLASWYPEMVPHIPHCRFSNCIHMKEPGCAVKAAVENEIISELRYKNYTQLLEELS